MERSPVDQGQKGHLGEDGHIQQEIFSPDNIVEDNDRYSDSFTLPHQGRQRQRRSNRIAINEKVTVIGEQRSSSDDSLVDEIVVGGNVVDQKTKTAGAFNLEMDGMEASTHDMGSLHTEANVNVDWLNNQMQIAISSGVLDVTCKNYSGQLHLDQFGSGNRGKCILAYNQWFTPSEFEAFCGRAQCKDWKRSIKFQDRSLLQLIELDILKVHAVSCTCASCWNGESEGPVRYHEAKRKSSSLMNREQLLQGDQQVAKKRLYTHSQNRSVNEQSPATDSTPVTVASKQLKIELPSTTSTGKNRVSLSGTLIESPGGTLKLMQPSGERLSNSQQTVTVIVPGKNKQVYTCVPKASDASSESTVTANGQQEKKSGIPLGVTYAPFQLVSSGKNEVTAHSAGILADLGIVDEAVHGMQSQLNSVRTQVRSLRVNVERVFTELTYQLNAEKETNQKLRLIADRMSKEQAEHKTTSKRCANCNRVASLTCAACQSVFYCGEFCVRRDALNHRDQCLQRPPNRNTVNID